MADQQLLARAYHLIMMGFVGDGRAPHYTELSKALGLMPEEARQVQRDLLASGLFMWFYPDTDYIAGFPPFSNIPTQYKLSVAGEQRWYAI